MPDPIPSPDPAVTPEQVFVAYAKWKNNKEAYPKTKAFHEERWNLISEQIGITIGFLDQGRSEMPGATLLSGLVQQRARTSSYEVVGRPVYGRYPELDTSIERVHLRSLMKKSLALRSEYDEMGGKLFDQLFPEIRAKQITWRHLISLGLPVKAPNQIDECFEAFEAAEEEEEALLSRELTPEEIDEKKRQEEGDARAKIAHDKLLNQVRTLAVERGMGTMEEINHVLHDMPARDFVEFVSEFPPLTRGDFRPDRFSDNPPYTTLP